MSSGNLPSSWQRRIINKITEAENQTYSLYELKPNRKRDREVYQFSGTDDGCVHQISQFLSFREFINRKFGDWEFKDLITAFEEGFVGTRPAATPGQSVATPWGKPYKNRPRFLELWPEDQAEFKGYYGYSFWPDREIDTIYKLIGNPEQILGQALNIMQEGVEKNFDWEDFVKDFESGFPGVIFQSVSLPNKPWGGVPSERPKFYDLWSEAGAKFKGYYGVILEPNRQVESERFVLIGNRREIAQQAVRIMQERELLNNVQRFVGMPVSEYLRRNPRVHVALIITLTTYKKPPFYQTQERGKFLDQTITIPFPNRAKLTYNNIREACGGDNGLNWGRYRASAWIIPREASSADYPKGKGAAQLWVSGSSESNAKANLQRFLALSEGRVLRINKSESEMVEGQTLTSYDVYPKQMYVANHRLLESNSTQGRRTMWGRLDSKDNDFPLWPKSGLPRWEETLRELLTWGNSNPGQNP